jgi:CBS-domain-containing membrane protein
VVDEEAHVIGMITDRDVCMAAYTQGKPLCEISVHSACSRAIYTCQGSELVTDAAQIMARAQVRRLPVVDADDMLVGILTLSDLARHAWFARADDSTDHAKDVESLLEAVSRPRLEGASQLAPSGPTAPMTRAERQFLAAFDAP